MAQISRITGAIEGRNEGLSENKDAPTSALVLFYINSFLTLLAGNMFNYAMVILARSLTGSDGFTGLVFLGLYGPTLFLGLYAGILLDRHNRKNFLYITQFVFIANCVAFAACIAAGALDFETRWLVVLSAVVHGCSLAFLIPGRFAFVGNLVGSDHAGRVTIVLNILVITAFGSAPILVGLLKSFVSYDTVFLLIGAGFVIAYLFLPPIRALIHRPPEHAVELREGLRYILNEKLVLELLIFSVIGFFVVGPIQVLLPEFARTNLGLGEGGRGAFMSMLGAGLFTGGVVARVFHRNSRRGSLILLCTFLAGVFVASIAGATSVFAASGFLALAGIFGGVLSTLIPAAIQDQTPDRYRGRVMSVYSMVFLAAPALSGVSMGLVADRHGLVTAILWAGVLVAVATVVCTPLLGRLRRHG